MGYESRLIVVDRVETGTPTGNTLAFGDSLVKINLCKMGYDKVNGKEFTEIFTDKIDFNLYEDDCEEEYKTDKDAYKKDKYGAWCKMTTLDTVIEWLEKANMDYRRARMCLDILKGIKDSEQDFGDIRVVHYGY